MAWIRLDDDYVYHPKFTVLSDRAFRLWHEGMGYCRKMMTDGLILASALKTFRYATKATVRELLTPASEGVASLWAPDPKGVRVHDYLDWNPSHEEDQRDREAAKQRMRAFRGKGKSPPVTPFVTPPVTPDVTPTVPGQGQGSGLLSSERESERKPPRVNLAAEDRGLMAARFCDRFVELYTLHRHGAHYHLKPNLDWSRICDLLTTYDAAHLEKLAAILLTTDDEWIAKTDRGIGVFVARVSWCEDRLKTWEADRLRAN